MRKLLTLILLAAALTVKAQDIPQVANILGRQTTSLNGPWHYIVDVQEEGYYDYRMKPMRNGFFINAKPQRPEDLIEYDFDKSETMQIPGDWNTQDQRLFFYEGTVWLKRRHRVPPRGRPSHPTLLRSRQLRRPRLCQRSEGRPPSRRLYALQLRRDRPAEGRREPSHREG